MRQIIMKNKKLYHENHSEFLRTFGRPLTNYWDMIFGFYIIQFDADIWCPKGVSLKDYLSEKFGEKASDLIYRLIS